MQNRHDNSDERDALQRSLTTERDKLTREIKWLQSEIQRMELESQIKEARLGHVQALLSSEPRPVNQRPSRRAKASTPTAQLLDMAEAVLRERKAEPMHYRDLADELMLRGAVIRGKDPAAALVSRMTQDDNRRSEGEKRFIRPTSKGFYALREDYPGARNVGARRGRQLNGSDDE